MSGLDEKDLYSEAGELLRHYLSWREKLLAGYMAVIAALAVAVGATPGRAHFGSAMGILGMVLTGVFWLLERRNRRLFLTCIEAGANLERDASLDGAFTALDKLSEKRLAPAHSTVLDWFFRRCNGCPSCCCRTRMAQVAQLILLLLGLHFRLAPL